MVLDKDDGIAVQIGVTKGYVSCEKTGGGRIGEGEQAMTRTDSIRVARWVATERQGLRSTAQDNLSGIPPGTEIGVTSSQWDGPAIGHCVAAGLDSLVSSGPNSVRKSPRCRA